jgi:hypothetical protein
LTRISGRHRLCLPIPGVKAPKRQDVNMRTNSLRLAAVVSLTCGALLVGPASEAGPITITTIANAAVSPGKYEEKNISSSLNPFTDLDLTSLASVTYIQSNLTTDIDVSAYAFVVVAGGSLSMGMDTQSNSSTTIGSGPVSATTGSGVAIAGLNVSDGLTVVGGPDSGLLALNFAMSGSLSTATSGSTTFANTAAVGGTFSVNATSTELNAHSQNGPGGNTGPMFLTFPSTWSVLLPYSGGFANMDLRLNSTATTNDACFGIGTCTELAWGSLGHTFTLGSIQVLDQSGQLVSGAYALGDSGISYNSLPPASVPDTASTMLMLGLGLSMLAGHRRCRRSDHEDE